MDLNDKQQLLALVEAARAWVATEEPDISLDAVAARSAKLHPLFVRVACGSCYYQSAAHTCLDFEVPPDLPARQPGESIPVPRERENSMFCAAFLEKEIAQLVRLGYRPDQIEYRRRHPDIQIPFGGGPQFAAYLASIPRGAAGQEPARPAGAAGTVEGRKNVAAPPAPPTPAPVPASKKPSSQCEDAKFAALQILRRG